MKGDAARYGIKFLVGKRILSGVPVIIKNSKGEILLGKRNKKMLYYPDLWGLPGGLIEFGETIEQAAKREVKEELGIGIKVLKFAKPWMQLPVKECKEQAINVPIYGKVISGTPKPLDETSDVRWFKPQQIRKMKLAYAHKQILENEGLIK